MNRIEVAQSKLDNVDVLVIDDPIDLYYLTGVHLSLGRLLIWQSSATLYVDGRYIEACQKQSQVNVSQWDWKSPLPITSKMRVGFDSLKMSYDQVEKLKATQGTLVPLKGPILKQRLVKDELELTKLAAAAKFGMEGYEHVIESLEDGITERELAIKLEVFWKMRGAEALAFEPIIAFGENGSKPHYRASDRRLKKGDAVLVDLGVVLDSYHSDMTRVVFYGEQSSKMEKVYNSVLEAQLSALSLCKAGVSIREPYLAALKIIEDHGHEFIHSLGHGIGLEVHEPPRLADVDGVLEENMVITIEPGIYIPDFGGVRIEDTIVIKNNGFENLTELTKKCINYI